MTPYSKNNTLVRSFYHLEVLFFTVGEHRHDITWKYTYFISIFNIIQILK